jgi:AcrR family transcriptional regulator
VTATPDRDVTATPVHDDPPLTRAPRRAGRPRDPDVDAAILGAAVRLLDEVGYQEMSIAAIAAAAHVGRPAVYRRYRTKADVVAAAILRLTAGPDPDLPADPRQALRVLLGAASGVLATPGGLAALGSLLAEQRRDPELLAAFRARIFEPRRAVIHRVLLHALERGEIAPDADLEAIDSLLFGALLARAILAEPVDDAWIDRVVGQAWRGIPASAARSRP